MNFSVGISVKRSPEFPANRGEKGERPLPAPDAFSHVAADQIFGRNFTLEISEPTVVIASASLQVSHFNYYAFAIFKILTSLD